MCDLHREKVRSEQQGQQGHHHCLRSVRDARERWGRGPVKLHKRQLRISGQSGCTHVQEGGVRERDKKVAVHKLQCHVIFR